MSRDARPTPWFWGVNGAAGVLASGVAVACSIVFSIDTTIRIGSICYLILVPAALLLIRTSERGVGVEGRTPNSGRAEQSLASGT